MGDFPREYVSLVSMDDTTRATVLIDMNLRFTLQEPSMYILQSGLWSLDIQF